MNKQVIAIAIGFFIGNWIVVPVMFHNRTLTEGFLIGIIAAGFILLTSVFIKKSRTKRK